MKDEEMAEEIANRRCHEIMCYGHCSFNSPKHHRCGEWHREYNCALAGLKAGRPQWHDLRESPNDLPDNGILVLCIDKVWTGQTFTTILRCSDGVFIDDNETPYDVIAWCEIPTFDKE